MKFPCYTGRGLLDLMLWLPLLAQAGLFATALAGGMTQSSVVGYGSLALFELGALYICHLMGFALVSKRVTPDDLSDARAKSFFRRYQPVILAASYTAAVALVAILLPRSENHAVFGSFASCFGLAHITSCALLFLLFIFTVPSPWPLLAIPLLIYAAYASGMVRAFHTAGAPRCRWGGGALFFAALLAVLGFVASRAIMIRQQIFVGKSTSHFADQIELEPYHPYEPDNRLVKVSEPGLTISENYPRLDGATAAYPVYAAAAQALYAGAQDKGVHAYLNCSKTSEAYQKLIDGNADIIFALQPSQEQLTAAKAAGVTLHFTPIAKEAFVFFVNEDNPVNGLTTAQIRAIYTKALKNWSELGGADQKIIAFQRPPNSGSQTALEEMVMKGEKLARAPREEVAVSMGGIIQQVASYQNARGAIGYSFRYYATRMNPIKGIKLLAIDGIAPTPETVRSGAYPYTAELYAITAGSKNPHTQELINWFLSPAGQKMIEETGYVGIKLSP